MNKWLYFFATFLIISCSEGEPKNNQVTETPTAKDPEITKGLRLVANSDCLSCHKIGETLTGPSYISVSKRYKNQAGVEEKLAVKIINGGSGSWGQVPMTPHPSLSKEDAKLMVRYILSLKEE